MQSGCELRTRQGWGQKLDWDTSWRIILLLYSFLLYQTDSDVSEEDKNFWLGLRFRQWCQIAQQKYKFS